MEHDRAVQEVHMATAEPEELPADGIEALLTGRHVLVQAPLQSTFYPHKEQLGEKQQQLYRLREQVTQEQVVIPDADAVVDPWAVVVVALHTSVACGTMSRSRGPHDLAVRTEVN